MKLALATFALAVLPSLPSQAAILLSGSTTVGLDTATLTSVGIGVAGASGTGTVNSTGFAAGLTNVAFAITTSTSLDYTPAFPALGSFAGSIEHSGSVTLAIGPAPATNLTVGNFSIRFDAARATGARSGFYVQDFLSGTPGTILFDLGAISSPPAGGTAATGFTATNDNFIAGPFNVLVSPELATALTNQALSGADIGDARVDGLSAIPEPGTTLLGALTAGALLMRRRRA